MTAVADRQRLEPDGAEDLAWSPEALTEHVAGERLDGTAWDQRGEKPLVGTGALVCLDGPPAFCRAEAVRMIPGDTWCETKTLETSKWCGSNGDLTTDEKQHRLSSAMRVASGLGNSTWVALATVPWHLSLFRSTLDRPEGPLCQVPETNVRLNRSTERRLSSSLVLRMPTSTKFGPGRKLPRQRKLASGLPTGQGQPFLIDWNGAVSVLPAFSQ
jgi:hypothetical protein